MDTNEYVLGEKALTKRFFGVYKKASLVPTFGVNPFDTPEWIETNKPRVLQMKQMIESGREDKSAVEAYLFLVISVIKSKIAKKGRVKIVDIGGGCGENYISIIKCLGTEGIEYHVIEQKRNCEAGRELKLSGNLYFHENKEDGQNCLVDDVQELLKKADICLIIGTLQYFSEYEVLLKEIAETKVEYIYITRTIMTDAVNTYYTRQYIASNTGRYKDVVVGDIPVAVVNHQELNDKLINMGYEICLDLFQVDYSCHFSHFEEPYNKTEYRDILYRLRE